MTRSPGVALILIDVINGFTFPGGAALRRHALPAARRISGLKRRAQRAKIPVIYVNDHFGNWQSDFRSTVAHCQRSPRARDIISMLSLAESDYFVLKPRHSGFYLSPLELLLHDLDVHTLILTGFATNMCVLFTAADAHMRYFNLVIPSDCVAAERVSLSRSALDHMRRAFAADTTVSTRLELPKLKRRTRKARTQWLNLRLLRT